MIERWRIMGQAKGGAVSLLKVHEGGELAAWERADALMADFACLALVWCEPVPMRERLAELGLVSEKVA